MRARLGAVLLLVLAATQGCLINQKLYDELRPELPPECGTDEAEDYDGDCVEPEEDEAS
jgi:hypothetical protein